MILNDFTNIQDSWIIQFFIPTDKNMVVEKLILGDIIINILFQNEISQSSWKMNYDTEFLINLKVGWFGKQKKISYLAKKISSPRENKVQRSHPLQH